MANSRKDHRPTCRLCGAKHFSSEPHTFEDTKAVGVARGGGKTAKQKPVKKVKKKSKAKAGTDVERVQRWREENRDRYNEYQRKLMRKRRAKS